MIKSKEVKVKVWCEKCFGKGKRNPSEYIGNTHTPYSPFKCKDCKGLGYQEKTFVELK